MLTKTKKPIGELPIGAQVVPGSYTVRVIAGAVTQEQPLSVHADPRATWTQADYAARYQFFHQLNSWLSDIDVALNTLDDLAKRGKLDARGRAIYDRLTSDPINSEDDQHRADRLRERLQILMDLPALSQGPPTAAQLQEQAAIGTQFDALMSDYKTYISSRR